MNKITKTKWFKYLLGSLFVSSLVIALPITLVSCSKSEKDASEPHSSLDALYTNLQNWQPGTQDNVVTDKALVNYIEEQLNFGNVVRNLEINVQPTKSKDLTIDLTINFIPGVSFLPATTTNENITINPNSIIFKNLQTSFSKIILSTLTAQNIQQAINTINLSDVVFKLDLNSFNQLMSDQFNSYINGAIESFIIKKNENEESKNQDLKTDFSIVLKLKPNFSFDDNSSSEEQFDLSYVTTNIDLTNVANEIATNLSSKIKATNINDQNQRTEIEITSFKDKGIKVYGTYANDIFIKDGLVSPTYVYEMDIYLNKNSISWNDFKELANNIQMQIFQQYETLIKQQNLSINDLFSYEYNMLTNTIAFQIRTLVLNVSRDDILFTLDTVSQIKPDLLTKDIIAFLFNLQNIRLISDYKWTNAIKMRNQEISIQFPQNSNLLIPDVLKNLDSELELINQSVNFDSSNNTLNLSYEVLKEDTTGLIARPTVLGFKKYAQSLTQTNDLNNLFNKNIISNYINIPASQIELIIGKNSSNYQNVDGKLMITNMKIKLSELLEYSQDSSVGSFTHEININNLMTNIPFSSVK